MPPPPPRPTSCNKFIRKNRQYPPRLGGYCLFSCITKTTRYVASLFAWFKRGFADAQKTNKKSAQNVLVSKAPSERGLPSQAGGGACVNLEFYQILRCTHSPSVTPCVVPPPSAGRHIARRAPRQTPRQIKIQTPNRCLSVCSHLPCRGDHWSPVCSVVILNGRRPRARCPVCIKFAPFTGGYAQTSK